MRRTNSGTFKNKPDIIDIILETAKLDSGLYNRNEMRNPPMASMVGFMFLDRQNVVADRDVQTPMGQMENAHSHEGQSVVRGGQVVFQRKLAIATAQIVYPIYLIVIQLPAVGCEAHFQLADQLCLERRVTDGVQIIQIGPLGLAGAQMVQVDLIVQLGFIEDVFIRVLAHEIVAHKIQIGRENALILNLTAFAPDADAQMAGLVLYQATAAKAVIFQAAEPYERRKVVQPRGCLSLGILAAIRRLSPAAAGVLRHMSDGLLDRIHSNIPNPADRRQIGVDRAGGIPFLDQKIGIILYVRLAVIKVPAFIIIFAPIPEFNGVVLILPFAFFRNSDNFCGIAAFVLSRRLQIFCFIVCVGGYFIYQACHVVQSFPMK